ncbi:MAG TPA: hypothetical protein VI759_02810 [Dehalococcoidia bacterium]|nr:hypothetical protein [Dehalococcoidia bacterium]
MTTDAAAAPPKLPFPLQPQERVLLMVRRHWVYLWPIALLHALFGIVPVVLAAFVLDAIGVMDDIGGVFWIVAGVYLLFWAVRIFLGWYRYHNDIWVITNQRIVDSLKSNPLSLRIATADLVNIQDMTVERDGLLRTMLDYGDIVCQTAAELQEFRLVGVPDPRDVQALVDRERDRARSGG